MRQNKYAKWHACKRCGLRLSYTTKGTYQGETRAIGPDPLHVEAAQLELKEQHAPMNMNEKIFNGKLMEIRGRGLVQTGGAGRTTVEIKGRRAPWEVPHGRLQHDGSWYGFNYNADYANPDTAQCRGVQPGAEDAVSYGDSQGCGKGQGACEKGAHGTSDAEGCAVNTGDGASEGGDQPRGGRRADGGVIGGGGLSALWNALTSLRERMQKGDNAPDHSQHRLEAEHGNQYYNLHYDNTSNYTKEFNDTTTNDFEHGTGTDASPVDDGDLFHLSSAPNVTKKMVRPVLARRLAQAAALTTVLMQPVKELFSSVNQQLDVMEVACSPTSELSTTFEAAGYTTFRVNYKSGFDLDTKKGTTDLKHAIEQKHPKLTWVSMQCTRLSSLQNLTPRTPEQWDKFMKRRGQDLRRNEEVVESLDSVLANGDDIAWEWPALSTCWLELKGHQEAHQKDAALQKANLLVQIRWLQLWTSMARPSTSKRMASAH